MSVTSGTKRKEGGFGETDPRDLSRADHRAGDPHLPVSAVQYSLRLDEGDAAGRRLSVRVEIQLRLQQYSLPLSPPLFSGRLPSGWQPQRGDVVVFRLPRDHSIDYIKRVIGLPGDKIQMIDGQAPHQRRGRSSASRRRPWIDDEEGVRETPVKRWSETLPNGVSYTRSIWWTTALPTIPTSTRCRRATIS